MYNLLIVDDDWVQRKLLIRMIINCNNNFKIAKEAENGKQALSFISEKAFDAIISDIKMPILNGIELLKELREIYCLNIPLILISTYSDFEFAHQGILYNAFDYLLKPVEKNSLHRTLTMLQNHLDLQKNQNEEKNNIEKFLDNSVEAIYSEDDEHILYDMIFHNNEKLDIFLDHLVKKISHFHKYDIFNIGLTLDNIQKKIFKKIVKNYAFLEFFDDFNYQNYSPLRSLDNILEIKTKFIANLKTISQKIYTLHLNEHNTLVMKMCIFAMNNIDKHIKIEDLSSQLNYSTDHLLKTFKHKTGTSFLQYSTRLKMEKAKALLKSGYYKNYEICQLVGYKDYNHFSKVFKNHFGNSLSEYKKLGN